MAKKILIIDDEEKIRELLTEAFEGFGYQVATAMDGPQGLKILAQDPMQVILLDLNLPGMNGLEVCERIRSQYPRACIYAVTGYHDVYTPDDCLNAGFDDFFAKPVNLHLLHNAVLRGFEKLEGI